MSSAAESPIVGKAPQEQFSATFRDDPGESVVPAGEPCTGAVTRPHASSSVSGAVITWLRKTFGVTARKGTLALIDQLVVSGTNFLTTVIVGRACGADELGIYALGFTLVLLTACVHESLVSTPYVIYGNRLREKRRSLYAGSVLVHHAMLVMLAMTCLAIFAAALSAGLGTAALAPTVWVLVGVVPFALLREFARRIAFAHMHMSTALVLDLLVATIQIGGLAALAAVGALSAGVAYVVLGVSCAVAGATWLGLHRARFTVRWRRVGRDLRQNWLFGKWVFAGLVSFIVHVNVVHWLLALVLGTAATGEYAACMTVVMICNPFVQGISNVLVPRAARAFADGGVTEVRRVARKTTLLLGMAMGSLCSILILFGGSVVALLYGSQYVGHGITVAVLATGMLVRSLGMSAFIGLVAVERPDVNFKINLAGLAVTVVLACMLMTTWGVVGGACGLLAGDIAAAAARWNTFLRSTRGVVIDGSMA